MASKTAVACASPVADGILATGSSWETPFPEINTGNLSTFSFSVRS